MSLVDNDENNNSKDEEVCPDEAKTPPIEEESEEVPANDAKAEEEERQRREQEERQQREEEEERQKKEREEEEERQRQEEQERKEREEEEERQRRIAAEHAEQRRVLEDEETGVRQEILVSELPDALELEEEAARIVLLCSEEQALEDLGRDQRSDLDAMCAALEAEIKAEEEEAAKTKQRIEDKEQDLAKRRELQADLDQLREKLDEAAAENKAVAERIDCLEKDLPPLDDIAAEEAVADETEAIVAKQGGVLLNLWELTTEKDKIDELEGHEDFVVCTPLSAARQQLEAVQATHSRQEERYREIEQKLAQQRASADQRKADFLRKLDAEFAKEAARMATANGTIKNLLEEQAYHIRRGTYIKERKYIPKFKDQDLPQQQEGKVYAVLCRDIVEAKDERAHLTDAVRQLKRQRKAVKEQGNKETSEARERLEAAEAACKEAQNERDVLAAEEKDLMALRGDIVRAQGNVRRSLRE